VEYLNHLYKVGYKKEDFRKISPSKFSFENLKLDSKQILLFDSQQAQETRTVFYFIDKANLQKQELRELHTAIWNENKADFYIFPENNNLIVKYAKTLPTEKNNILYSIQTNTEDDELLDKISKHNLQNGMFWFELKEKLDKLGKQTVDKELIRKLDFLRNKIKNIYKTLIPDDELRIKYTQALIDRTLFIKFLEDKKIVNAWYSQNYQNYKAILEEKNGKKLNNLYLQINHIFNNSLFADPYIPEEYLTPEVLQSIWHLIKKTETDGQLTLFDFKFDIIPPETISLIYEVFLKDEKKEKGIFYTPLGLANLIVRETIHKVGRILDPSCGSGAFLISAFDRLVELTEKEKKNTISEELKRLNKLLVDNIFGIELKEPAQRLSVFSLSLKLLSSFEPNELRHYISENIEHNKDFKLFDTNFSKNIIFGNSLQTEDSKKIFLNETFDFIVGNPPWKSDAKEIEKKYWNKYKTDKETGEQIFEGKIQLSQLFLHKIKEWSHSETRFGFVVNSSNFQGENAFQEYFYRSNRISKIFELSKLNDYLFENATEPAIVLIFDNKPVAKNTIKYIAPEATEFSKTFKLTIYRKSDFIDIQQNELFGKNKTKSLRQYLLANSFDNLLIEKLQNPDSFDRLENHLLKDEKGEPFLKQGITIFGQDALTKFLNRNSDLPKKQSYEYYHDKFYEIYKRNQPENNFLPYLKNKCINYFKIEEHKIKDYYFNDLKIYNRGRQIENFEGEKLICIRVGNQFKASYSNSFIFYSTQLLGLKLENPDNYFLILAIINSKVTQYLITLVLKTRVQGNQATLNDEDILKLPIPKYLPAKTVSQITELSKAFTEGLKYEGENEKKLNELVFDLYGLSYYERRRAEDFYKTGNVSDADLETYCETFTSIVGKFIADEFNVTTDKYISEPTNFGIAVVKISFNEKGKTRKETPNAKQSNRYLLSELLANAGETNIFTIRERIYSENTIYMIKDRNIQDWTVTRAYEDAQSEIQKMEKA
jgi:type I restriction-modification system DNA methylase subunit